MAVIRSPADLANTSLARIGYADRVGNLYEGSKAAKQILDIYGQTRDELLRSFDWGFAERNINMVLLKFAPAGGYFPPTVWNPATDPPPPWSFSYQYPSDCLKVRAIKGVSAFVQNFDPQPFVFSVENDATFSPPQRVILCNVANAMLCYTGQITDPQTWDEGYDEEFSIALAKRLAPVLGAPEAQKTIAQDETLQKQISEMEQG